MVPYVKIPGPIKKDQGINLAWDGLDKYWISDVILLSFKIQFTCFH